MRPLFCNAFVLFVTVLAIPSHTAAADTKPPLRVVIAGLVHGHADGFLSRSLHRPEIQIIAIAEPDRALFDQYAPKFHLDPSLYHHDLDEPPPNTKPQPALA